MKGRKDISTGETALARKNVLVRSKWAFTIDNGFDPITGKRKKK